MKNKILLLLAFTISGLSSTLKAQLPSYVPVNGLVSWWQFTKNTNDGSGKGHNGTIAGTWYTTDRFNQDSNAFYFAGANQQIRCTNDTMLTNNRNLTASAWFYAESRASWDQNIVVSNIGAYQASGGFQIVVGNPPNASLGGMFRNTTFADQPNTVNSIIDSSKWYHAVYSLEYMSGVDSTKTSLYLNGVLIKTQNFKSYIVYSGIAPVIIGNNYDSLGFQRSFKGKLDDLGIWNRALTQSEITSLYNSVSVGIKERERNDRATIYPNPAEVELNVSVKEHLLGSSFKIKDVSGRIVMEGTLESLETKIPVGKLPTGVYVIQIGEYEKQLFHFIKK